MDIYDYLKDILPKMTKPTIFEIGAARGEDTALIKALAPDSNYYAFEPEPRNLEMLRAADLDVNIVDMAVGRLSGGTTFYQSYGWNPHAGDLQKHDHSLSGSIRKPKNHLQIAPWCEFKSAIPVKIITLDQFCKFNNIEKVDFIWCDIQGAEADMLLGGKMTVSKLDWLYMEVSDDELYEGQWKLTQLMELLPDFEIIHKFPDDVLLKRKG